ncbi:MAG TPA: serine hydrolase domain-containing protein [Longimicrobium sp.]|jgi:CubicO group peptidase (beta-lactamase class C family)|uniref:serine hydrolase domain-containing protein n=1 Tax=Longimicrobium sp. TaxID=2029185 RepID=UPI002ED95068
MIAYRRSLLVLAFTLGACAPHRPAPVAPAPDPSVAQIAALDEKAPLWLAEHHVPSIAVAYIRDGRVQWTKVYGEQSEGVPATAQTLYNVASLAKPVFAETMLRLAAEGRLSLDEPLAGHWIDPDVAADPRHQKLTPRIALSHRTGFTNWRYQTGGKLVFGGEPGATFGYSGEGYEYTRRFAQNKLGTPWEALASRYVFQPFGMTSTSNTRRDWFAGRIAVPYGREGRYGEPTIQDSALASDDLYTTVGDYAAFVVGVMNRDGLPAAYAAQRDSAHVANEAAAARCDRARVTHCARVGMGLGWEILEYPGESVRLHTGGDWGESTLAFYIAERREGAVMLTNGAAGMMVMLRAVNLLFPDTWLADEVRSYY